MNKTITREQFDSITYDDVLKLRAAKEKHALKLDDLDIPLKTADEYVEVITEFLSDLNFSDDRIEAFECRRRDGYIPFSHNKGGLEGVAYMSQNSACSNTGFKDADKVLDRNSNYMLQCFAEYQGLDVAKYDEWTEAQREQWYEYESNDDDTIQFQARVMFTSETTANIDFYVSASDSPYHRQSDDRLELEIEFKSPAGLKRKLKTIAKHAFVQKLARNVREGF